MERAHVNLATNTATVEYDPTRTNVAEFVRAIEDIGYGVPERPPAEDEAERAYRRRFIVAALFAAPVLVLGMSHGYWHVPYSNWIQLALTLPVIYVTLWLRRIEPKAKTPVAAPVVVLLLVLAGAGLALA